MPFAHEVPFDHRDQHALIVDVANSQPALVERCRRRRIRPGKCRWADPLRCGQEDLKGCAVPGLAADRDRAAMLEDDAMDDR